MLLAIVGETIMMKCLDIYRMLIKLIFQWPFFSLEIFTILSIVPCEFYSSKSLRRVDIYVQTTNQLNRYEILLLI